MFQVFFVYLGIVLCIKVASERMLMACPVVFFVVERRGYLHLPDGPQESCSDSGLGDHEPVGSGTLISHPSSGSATGRIYDQASPDKRTEADGNSDPNSVSPHKVCLEIFWFSVVPLEFNSNPREQVNGHSVVFCCLYCCFNIFEIDLTCLTYWLLNCTVHL